MRGRAALAIVALWGALWFLYSSPLRTTYYIIDEVGFVRPEPFPVLGAFWMPFVFGLYNGRPVSYFVWGLYVGIASHWGGLHGIRVFHFGLSCAAASLLLVVLYRRSRSIGWALFVVLFLCSQPLVQVLFAYSGCTAFWLAAVLSCAAFLSLHRHGAALHNLRGARRELLLTAGLLFLSWMMFQASAFCGLALAAYYALSSAPARWPAERRVVVTFIALVIGTMVVYTAVFKGLLAVTGAETTGQVDRALAAVAGAADGGPSSPLRLTNYLGPFEWWNYPVLIERWSIDRFTLLASATAYACLIVLSLSLVIEAWRSDLGSVVQRYGLALLAVLLTFLPLIADGFTMRQYLYIACVPAIVLSVGYAASVILETMRLPRLARLLMAAAAVAGLCVVVWGARADFDRALVQPHARYFSFAREAARRAAGKPFERVVVVNANPGCCWEPCRGMYGIRMGSGQSPILLDFHRKIVQDETGRTDFTIEFADPLTVPERDPATTLWIDYRELQKTMPPCRGAQGN